VIRARSLQPCVVEQASGVSMSEGTLGFRNHVCRRAFSFRLQAVGSNVTNDDPRRGKASVSMMRCDCRMDSTSRSSSAQT
jgi:hypothetical protein